MNANSPDQYVSARKLRCLLVGREVAAVSVHSSFLHLMNRQVLAGSKSGPTRAASIKFLLERRARAERESRPVGGARYVKLRV